MDGGDMCTTKSHVEINTKLEETKVISILKA